MKTPEEKAAFKAKMAAAKAAKRAAAAGGASTTVVVDTSTTKATKRQAPKQADGSAQSSAGTETPKQKSCLDKLMFGD